MNSNCFDIDLGYAAASSAKQSAPTIDNIPTIIQTRIAGPQEPTLGNKNKHQMQLSIAKMSSFYSIILWLPLIVYMHVHVIYNNRVYCRYHNNVTRVSSSFFLLFYSFKLQTEI